MGIFIAIGQKYDHIAPFRRSKTVIYLVDQNILPVIKAGLHGSTNHAGLQTHGINKHKGYQNRQHEKETPASNLL
jgi:hypothetical protein